MHDFFKPSGKLLGRFFWIVVLFWLAVGFSPFMSPDIGSKIGWAGLIVGGLHALEALMILAFGKKHLQQPARDLALILVFGGFRLIPMMKESLARQIAEHKKQA
ncbi:hypothetical protein [Pelagibaculum spongiae]|uniref:DUF1145 domain-containing protein n=1 Tax=Pelagibaculum spongiae TaxID=2080658 RepID=A0A2V1H4S1_9GAMM|nr:hypothetical protein [Pelagibaculum spongiae]PVZ70636.1 hypothetical protein DC094_08650 [Pelagibaculum spongiae]